MPWTPIPYSDNLEIISAIENSTNGLYTLLDSACRTGNSTGQKFCAAIHQAHTDQKSKVIGAPKLSKKEKKRERKRRRKEKKRLKKERKAEKKRMKKEAKKGGSAKKGSAKKRRRVVLESDEEDEHVGGAGSHHPSQKLRDGPVRGSQHSQPSIGS